MFGFQLKERATRISNRSAISYSVYVPWIWLYTLLAFRREKDPKQRERNMEIRAALLCYSLLFGECLMLVARKSAGGMS